MSWAHPAISDGRLYVRNQDTLRRLRHQGARKMSPDTTNISGKVVVITGASSGLGEATARLSRRARGNGGAGSAARRAASDAGRRDHARGRQGVRTCDRRHRSGAGSGARRRRRRAVRPRRRDAQQRRRDAAFAARAAEDRRLEPHDRHQHQGRVVRHRRGAAAHAAAEGGAHHQRVVGRRTQGREEQCGLCGDKDRGAGASEGLRQEVKPWNLRTTIISPGAVATELPNSITEADVAKGIGQFYEEYAIPPESFARAVAFAIGQPEDVDINEILFRPTRQEL